MRMPTQSAFFFFNDTATTEIYTLSLHDALPILSGYAGVHQFCKIGAHAFIGMYTSLTQDVPPFVLVSGNPAGARGVNIEGLKRRGFTRAQIDGIRASYKHIYRSNLTLEEAKAALEREEGAMPEAAEQIRAM